MGILILLIAITPFGTKADDELLDTYISQLAWCESRWRENIKVWDVYSYSYGYLQFKIPTFLHYGKKYEILPDVFSEKEAKLLILNKGVQIAIAREMLREKNGYRHWLNCSRRIGLDDIPHYAFFAL